MKKLVMSILVIAILGFGGYYYWTSQKTETPTTETTDTPQTLVYENSEYGFSVELPSTWEGYVVKERASEGTDLPIFDFELQNESIFAISIMTNEEFSTITEEENPIVLNTKVGSNALYTFIGSGSQDSSEALYQRRLEVEDILKTFKAK